MQISLKDKKNFGPARVGSGGQLGQGAMAVGHSGPDGAGRRAEAAQRRCLEGRHLNRWRRLGVEPSGAAGRGASSAAYNGSESRGDTSIS
jgi:hypothetical protein